MRFAQTKEPWFSEIPAEWRRAAIKRIVSTKVTDGPHETPELSDDGVQFISAEAIKNNQIDFNLRRGFISPELHEQYSRKCKPQRGDIFVIKSGATTGNVAYVDVDFEFSIWSPLALIRCDKRLAFYKFVYYVLLSDVFRKQVELSWSFGTQQNIGMGVIERLKVPIPPISDQQRIAAYLDASCAAIDAAVAAKRSQLETLDELRNFTVHRAVTQGLNADAKMKTSGLDWVSEVPIHWRASRIRNVAKLSPGYSGSPPANDEQCAVVPMEQLYNDGRIDTSSTQPYEDVTSGLTMFEAGDVLFAKITPCMENGKGAFVENLPTRYAFGSTEFHVLRPYHAVDGRFLYFYTFNPIFRAYAAENMSGAAGQKRVSSRFLKDIRLFLPPLPEQRAISAFLIKKDNEFRKLFAQIERQIATLTAYRKSLIHECVTGQRRIAEADLSKLQVTTRADKGNI